MPTDVVDATLISAHSITPRAKQFLLRTEGHAFDFKPGQHVSVASTVTTNVVCTVLIRR